MFKKRYTYHEKLVNAYREFDVFAILYSINIKILRLGFVCVDI